MYFYYKDFSKRVTPFVHVGWNKGLQPLVLRNQQNTLTNIYAQCGSEGF
jgi:hypothetical protein